MSLRLEITPPGGPVRQVLLEPGRTRHVASPAEQYRLIGDPGEVLPSVSVRRVNNSLVVTGLSDERELEIGNFFGACSPGRDCALSIEMGNAAPALVTNEMTPISALSDGSFLLYGTSSEELSALAVAAPVSEGGLTPGTVAAGLAGLLGLGLAAAVGGGGGGGGSPSPAAGGPTAVLPATFTAPPAGSTPVPGAAAGGGTGTAPSPGAGAGIPAALASSVPVVTITDDSAGIAGRPVTFTFRMSEPVSGFTADDVIVTGGTRGALVALPDGLGYTMTVTPNAGVQSGTLTVEVPAGAVAGATGTPSAVSTRVTQAFDTQSPVLSITDATAGVAAGPVTFTFALSEAVTGFTAQDVNVTGGTRGALTALAGGLGYTMAVTPDAGVQSGTLAVEVPTGAFTDASGNALAVTGRATQLVDTAPPTVTITDDAATTTNRPVVFRFVFSEPVTGFAADDVLVTGGTRGALIAEGDGRGFTMTVAPVAGVQDGEIGLAVRAGAAADIAGNSNPGSPTVTQAIDTRAPTQELTSFTVADDVVPRRGNLVLGEFTNDNQPQVTLTLNALLGEGEVLALRRDGAAVAATGSGRSLSVVDGPLIAGGSTYVYTASIDDAVGNTTALDLNGSALGQSFYFLVL
jgi:hypothetical protein